MPTQRRSESLGGAQASTGEREQKKHSCKWLTKAELLGGRAAVVFPTQLCREMVPRPSQHECNPYALPLALAQNRSERRRRSEKEKRGKMRPAGNRNSIARQQARLRRSRCGHRHGCRQEEGGQSGQSCEGRRRSNSVANVRALQG